MKSAMSTIPTTFNEMLPSYTVIGGRERLGSAGLSAVVLNRGRRYARRSMFHDMKKTGFDQIVSVESPPIQYDIEELASQFPFVRFVLLKESISLGEQINLAVSELDTPMFFVLWNDLRFVAGGGAHRMVERLIYSADRDWEQNTIRRLCTVPVIQSPRFETLPTLRALVLPRKKEHTRSLSPSREGLRSLYPFDGVGIYDRERFILMGGFDGTLKSSYWQLMDFGFRAHLWGEEISVTQALKLSYEASPPVEDTSTSMDYHRFYLKNLAPVFRNDSAHLPLRRFPCFMLQTRESLFTAYEDFSDGRQWVHTNRHRWRCDPRAIAGLWNPSNAEENLFPLPQESSA
ncbi:MAG: hypothetical protein FWB78_12825 [Treponema sp.]|nr:hypothetical protein [Treponema sp.]